MNATLGWHDALRFGSPSGQAEIVSNAIFFKHAFVLAGKQRTNDTWNLQNRIRRRFKQRSTQGLVFAEKFRNSEDYDRRWPTGYGLERMTCALGGTCAPPVAAPQSQWNALWDRAKLRVKTYYKAE
jgi:hypothetical protein